MYVHEMIVLPVADTAAALPYDEPTKRVKEDDLKSMGEVSELNPGKSGDLTVELKSGSYTSLH